MLIASLFLSVAAAEIAAINDTLDAARAFCSTNSLDDTSRSEFDLKGWKSVAPGSDSWVAKSLANDREVLGDDSIGQVYSAEIASQKVYGFIDQYETVDGLLRVCTVRVPTLDLVEFASTIRAWAGRDPFDPGLGLPTELESGLENLVFRKAWKPGLDDGAIDTVIVYVPLKFDISGSNSGLSYISERFVEANSK